MGRLAALALPIKFAAGQSSPPELPQRVKYYGSDQPLPRQIPLRAGPLELVFEPELAQLRYLRCGDAELIRGIYAAVRDRNWGTVPPQIRNLRMATTDEGFQLSFEVRCRQGDIDFLWRGEVEGAGDGSVLYKFTGEALSTFLRNRIGFCVLHPDTAAGRPVVIQKTNGVVERSVFPRDISPHQPFMDIRSIRHTAASGLEAEVTFEGDVFEMEDQRNWTDASFKTYCTPLALPFPVEVKKGDVIRQSVQVRVHGCVGAAVGRRSIQPEVTIAVDEKTTTPLPALGLGLASDGKPLTPGELKRLRNLPLAHLRADLVLSDPAVAKEFERAAVEAAALGTRLELALTLDRAPEEELKAFVRLLAQHKPRVAHYLIFHAREKSTSERWVQLAAQILRAADPAARIGSGTNAYFTELNRGRPPVKVSDLVAYSINPQVHAFDNLSLVETLAVQAETLRSARKFCASLPLAVTPVTLKPRFNPNATGAPAARRDALPDEVDVRQMSLFGAAWTVGSLKYVSEGGAASVTYYETAGWRGVMERDSGPLLPQHFPSRPGMIFPLFHVLAGVREFAGGQVVHTRSSDSLAAEALLLRKGSALRALVANLSAQPRIVRLPFSRARVLVLDEHSFAEATSDTSFPSLAAQEVGTRGKATRLALLPYAVARVDVLV